MTVCQVCFLPGTTALCWLPLGTDWQAYRNPKESKNKIVCCTAQMKSAVLYSRVNSEQLAELALCLHQWKQGKIFGMEFLLETAVQLLTLLSTEESHMWEFWWSVCVFSTPCLQFDCWVSPLLQQLHWFLFIHIYAQKSIVHPPA